MNDQDNDNPGTMADRIRKKIAENPAESTIGNFAPANAQSVIAERYEIGQQIGSDEFTTTYSGTHLFMQVDINIRLLKDEFVGNTEAEEQFQFDVREQVRGLRSSPFGVPFDMGTRDNGVMYAILDPKKTELTKEDLASSANLAELIRQKRQEAQESKSRQ